MSSVVSENVVQFKLKDLATLFHLDFKGDPDFVISGVASLQRATAIDLCFCIDKSYVKYLAATSAGILITTKEISDNYHGATLITQHPEFVFAKCAALFKKNNSSSGGIHATAVIGNDCVIASDVRIGANCVIGNKVTIGSGTFLHANVVIYDGVIIGERVEIFSGSVIGADGFGFTNYKNEWIPIPQLGSVRIGNDVSIGALTTVDRGALDDTVIGDGVKIDNQVQIGHNVQIGAHTIIAGCTGIAGSVIIGKNCMIGGGVGIADHVEITDGVLLSGGSSVSNSIKNPGAYANPTIAILLSANESRRLRVHIKNLGSYIKRLIKLEKQTNE
jgi:UDP-3-O-[3-hydroxymyristoyl] glucosamine N-acyltransferase